MAMKVLIMGAGGMIGSRLAMRIAAEGIPSGDISKLVLHDLSVAHVPDAPFDIEVRTADASSESEASTIASERYDLIFNLAAIVSGEAEADFEKGWEINARGGWRLLEALRLEGERSGGEYRPRFVFSSSIAVFGGPYRDVVDDEFFCSPQSSYGAQKTVMELLVQDYHRKGFIDGMSLRLPTICVRPGKPNKAASSFFSGIIREPLNGEEAILPVSDTVRHWFASPKSAVGFQLHAASLSSADIGLHRSLSLPGVSCTVAEQIEALRSVAGEAPVSKIRSMPDEDIIKIVSGWPENFSAKRAKALGFVAETSFEEIVRTYIEEELN